MNNTSDNSKSNNPSSSTSVSSDRSANHKAHKARKSRSMKHVVVLPDGTRLIKSKRRRSLPDGSLFIKTKTESIAAGDATDVTSREGKGSHLIKTETERIRPDGSALTTTTTERIFALSGGPPPERREDETHAKTKILTDGTRIIKSKSRKTLPDGRLDTVTTIVRIADAPSPIAPASEQALRQFDLSSVPRKRERFNLQMPSICENRETESSRIFQKDEDLECPEVDYSFTSAPLPPLFESGCGYDDRVNAKLRAFELKQSDDQALEINDSAHEPMPPEFVEKESIKKQQPKLSKIGAQFVNIFSSPTSRNKKASVLPFSEANNERDEEEEGFFRSKQKSSHSSGSVPQDEKSKAGYSTYSAYTSDDKSRKGAGAGSFHSSVGSRSKTTGPGVSDEGLAVAKAVDEDDDDGRPIYAAIEYDPFSKPPLYMNRRCRVYSAIALLLICVATVIGVVYATRKVAPPPPPIILTQAPTLPPTPEPTSVRDTLGIRGYIEANVLMRNATFENMTQDDPHELAMEWILHEDDMQLDQFDGSLAQRYTMATLAFALDSAAWEECGQTISNELPGDSDFSLCSVELNSTGVMEDQWTWLSSVDECMWYGVTCVDGFVRWIEMHDNGLVGTLVPEVGGLKFLQIISLVGNCIYGTIPPELGKLKFLEILDLSQNGLSGSFPEDLFDVSSLVKLNVAYQYWNFWNCTRSDGSVAEIMYQMGDPENDVNNGVKGEILGTRIGNLQYLRELSINDNYFSGTISSEIGGLDQLVIFSAGTNMFNGTMPDEVTNLVNLRELWLEVNHVSGIIPESIGKLKSLEKFSVWNWDGRGDMNGSIPESLYDLVAMKVLFLQGNQFTGTISPAVGNLKKLEQFAINSNRFSGTLPTEIGLCEELNMLRIQHTNISGTVPDEVCELTNKNLNSDDEYVEYFTADCLADNETKPPFLYCEKGCCRTCCDHTTKICITDK